MNHRTWLCSLLALLLYLGAAPARAQVPTTMPLQGFLTDAAGAPITGPTDVTVSLYSVDVAGTALYTETQSVEVTDGHFTLYVGDSTPLDATLFRDQRTLFVGITLPGEAEMTPRFQLGSVPYAGFAAYAGAVAFEDVTGVPAGLVDGDDVGPAYAAGEGVTITGTTISVDRASTQARVSGACTAGAAIRAIDADGTVTCEAFVAPSYNAGAGLILTSTTFAADTAVLQARVGASCPIGQSIRAIAIDGTVICEVDDIGAAGTTYFPGVGLTMAGSTFSVDPSAVQTRVDGTCPAGGSIRAIAADGTVTCQPDTDTDTTYAAGTGLSLTGTTFAVDTAVLQSRIAASCPAGQSIRAIAADGTVSCEVDDDTDTNTTYAAGAGLSLTGTTFAVDPTSTQARVAATCAAGSSIRAIAADGTVACEVDDDTDTNTTYAAGTGLTLTGTTFAANTAILQARVGANCPAGQSIRAIAADGAVTCEVDDNTPTTYAAGTGLSLTGTTFAVDPTSTQARVAATCAAGSSIRAIAADGTVTCEPDDDTDTNTTYTAGTGLSLTGTTFAANTAVLQARVGSSCPAGQSIRAIAIDGTVTCEVDDNTPTVYAAGTGLSLTGTTFAVDPTLTQTRVAATCAAGSSIRAIAADGTVTCEPDDDTDTNTTYTAGTGLTLTGTTFAANTAVLQARVAGACGSGQAVTAINADGSVVCTATGALYAAGIGLVLTGTTFSVDSTAIQRRVTGTCAGGAISSIAADGSVVCAGDTTSLPPTGTGFDSTGEDGPFYPQANIVLVPGVYNFTEVVIPSWVTVTTNGVATLDIRATGTIRVNGAIDVSGSAGGDSVGLATGSGGGATGNPSLTTTPCTGGPGGSGTAGVAGSTCGLGGSFGGGAGGAASANGGGGGGYNGDTTGVLSSAYLGAAGNGCPGCSGGTGGRGGTIGAAASRDLSAATTFRAGSGGSGGSGTGLGTSNQGSGGGGGGGALRLSARGRIIVSSSGRLLANGGAGGRANCGGGGGGGSGGVIFVSSPNLAIAGAISASGGSPYLLPACWGDPTASRGGAGGLGRIRLSTTAASCTITGTLNPPLGDRCNPASTAERAYVGAYPN